MYKKLIIVCIISTLTILRTAGMNSPVVYEVVTFAHFGYTTGLTPLLWPAIPSFFTGSVAANHNKRSAVYAGAGFLTGVTVLGLAAYGADQLLTNNVPSYRQTKQTIKENVYTLFQ